MTKKIEHDYTCDKCGKPATKSIQDSWAEYDITETGDFDEVKGWDGGTNEFYCDECFEKEMSQ